jgi:uncharacterized protein YecT (DUF1311 family)
MDGAAEGGAMKRGCCGFVSPVFAAKLMTMSNRPGFSTRFVATALLAAIAAGSANHVLAQAQKADPGDTAAIQDCLKQNAGEAERDRACIGIIADACLKEPKHESAAAIVTCHVRERLVWDDIAVKTFEQLRLKVNDMQWVKLRDMQRKWSDGRKQTCEFYWEFSRGTAASPLSETCYRRETARRALYLLYFLDNAGKR